MDSICLNLPNYQIIANKKMPRLWGTIQQSSIHKTALAQVCIV